MKLQMYEGMKMVQKNLKTTTWNMIMLEIDASFTYPGQENLTGSLILDFSV